MTDQFDQFERLARKLVDVTIDADADPDLVFTALQEAFTFWMSCVCADCRQQLAQKLERDVPAMLDRANRYAMKSTPTCH
jgi:hypothetical protein